VGFFFFFYIFSFFFAIIVFLSVCLFFCFGALRLMCSQVIELVDHMNSVDDRSAFISRSRHKLIDPNSFDKIWAIADAEVKDSVQRLMGDVFYFTVRLHPNIYIYKASSCAPPCPCSDATLSTF
jgi:hypothetical protein